MASSKSKKKSTGKTWEDAVADGSFRKSLQEAAATGRQAELPLTLTPDEQYVVFAALCTMIDDVHAVQDTMTGEQWTVAEKLYKRLTKVVNKRNGHS